MLKLAGPVKIEEGKRVPLAVHMYVIEKRSLAIYELFMPEFVS